MTTTLTMQASVPAPKDMFVPCSSNTTQTDVVKVSGQTERQSPTARGEMRPPVSILPPDNAAKSCSRYTGHCSSASQCRDACYR